MVTAAVDPARLVTRIGVYIIIRGKCDGGDEFSGKNIREKMKRSDYIIIIIIIIIH